VFDRRREMRSWQVEATFVVFFELICANVNLLPRSCTGVIKVLMALPRGTR
jgi:hypothetical protein